MAPQASERLKATAMGLGMAVYAPVGFLFPLILILPVLFPRMAAAMKEAPNPNCWERSRPDWLLLILHVTLGGFLVLILGRLLTGASHYLERYMHPFFLLTPLWLLAMVERTGKAERKLVMLTVVFVAVTAIVLPLRVYKLLHAMEYDCQKCRVAIPYEGLVQALRARGFRAGTIIAADRHDAGNLRRLFPEARVVCLRYPAYGPRAADSSSKVAVVWKEKDSDRLRVDAEREAAKLNLESWPRPERIAVPWQPFPLTSPERSWAWSVVVVDPAGTPSSWLHLAPLVLSLQLPWIVVIGASPEMVKEVFPTVKINQFKAE